MPPGILKIEVAYDEIRCNVSHFGLKHREVSDVDSRPNRLQLSHGNAIMLEKGVAFLYQTLRNWLYVSVQHPGSSKMPL
jgi:hypothetical protein